MFKRIKRIERIENKLDALAEQQRIQTNMLASIIETLDARRAAGAQQRRALDDYIDSVSGILTDKGAPVEFVQSFKNLLRQNGLGAGKGGGNHE